MLQGEIETKNMQRMNAEFDIGKEQLIQYGNELKRLQQQIQVCTETHNTHVPMESDSDCALMNRAATINEVQQMIQTQSDELTF